MSLESLIIQEIKEKGPLPLSQYMGLCLYHPEYGYYMQKNPLGRAGDFITAPEISSLFGVVIRTAIEALTKDYCANLPVIAEFGGGRGTLMRDMLAPPFQKRPAHIVEISPFLKDIQKETLRGFDITWHTTADDLLRSIKQKPLAIIGNEFLDAFPIHQYIFTEDGWRERLVDLSDTDEFIFKTRATSFTPDKHYGDPKIGDIVEQNPSSLAYITPLLNHIKRYGGFAIFIDYGNARPAYGDTFQAIERHRHKDPLSAPGKADLTAHVDFHALDKTIKSLGLQTLPLLSQGAFLKQYGIDYYLREGLSRTDTEARQQLLSAAKRLMDPNHMGNLFKVLIAVSKM
jgi:NADH dehydrogenase [ubiquinone] 1 alpha subcomplex assembly factor 7